MASEEMAHYLINISFRAESEDQAQALESKVRDLAGSLAASGEIADLETDCALDWLAVPEPAVPLPAAANRTVTTGPPEEDDD